jgi:hypothetical protein
MDAEAAKNFLYKWRAVNIYAAHRTLDELDVALRQLMADAELEGLSLEELNAAAGGNFLEYVRQACAKRPVGGPA